MVQLLYLRLTQHQDRRLGDVVRAVIAVTIALHAAVAIAKEPDRRTEFVVARKAVVDYFAALEGYERGDLISRKQIAEAIAAVEAAGWKVPKGGALVALGVADDAALRKVLSTPAGRKLMRKVSSQPGAYARMDRLCSIPRGQGFLKDLTRKKGGDEFITYLITTDGGHRLGKQMAGIRGGVDLNKPTGRIYTQADLIAVLERVYEASGR